MIQEAKRPDAVNVLPAASKTITPMQFVALLRTICEERHQRYTSFREYAKNIDEKLTHIEIIRAELAIACAELNWREKLKTCLKTENFFKSIAPRTSAEAFNNFNQKIDACMSACREAIGWRAQS
ncbi:hypothetical protein BDE36_1805 [Arcticibacter tournemirensis]|uniref:Uncharacterized protein n=1 Tax=Arcticibacter tournemirensis TaxID=699437 RepID=A0A5M9H9X5_9SPHI|nr:hypothetical protein [Arcticibacter tournemirensis]KAA8483733.1 hypothetical protein F1649_07540 [Arcticibacter tournemirensis]TQM50070.1 hypothetical protein BDE36_1805 [Arcticibacter tournemirensis]